MQVVVLTMSRHTLDIYRAYELGANSYLVKPVSLDAFAEMVKSMNLQWLVASSEPEIPAEPSASPT
jgi:DNA-binding NarL/FixJ family response regulator